jgi:hypothetical protein
MPKRRHRTKVTEKPVFTFRQMERVVDLIDRQARLITGEKVLPVDEYVYAKNEGVDTYFIFNHDSETYYFTIKARKPAINNYYIYNKGQEYKDGIVGVYNNNSGAVRGRIYLENTSMYAKFNPNDANPDESTVTFYNIPISNIVHLYESGYIKHHNYDPYNYYTDDPVDYHRDYVAGKGPY